MITDLWISLEVQFKQHIEDCPLEGWAWGTITKFTEFTPSLSHYITILLSFNAKYNGGQYVFK